MVVKSNFIVRLPSWAGPLGRPDNEVGKFTKEFLVRTMPQKRAHTLTILLYFEII